MTLRSNRANADYQCAYGSLADAGEPFVLEALACATRGAAQKTTRYAGGGRPALQSRPSAGRSRSLGPREIGMQKGGGDIWPGRPTARSARSGCASTASCPCRSMGAKPSATKSGGIGEIPRGPREHEGAGIVEGRPMPGRARIPAGAPPEISAPSFMGRLKGKGAPPALDEHASLECEFGDGRFRAEGRCASTVGLDGAATAKRVGWGGAAGIALDGSGVKGRGGPFARRWLRPFDGSATGQAAVRPERSEGRAPSDARPAPQGLYPKSKPPL